MPSFTTPAGDSWLIARYKLSKSIRRLEQIQFTGQQQETLILIFNFHNLQYWNNFMIEF